MKDNIKQELAEYLLKRNPFADVDDILTNDCPRDHGLAGGPCEPPNCDACWERKFARRERQ